MDLFASKINGSNTITRKYKANEFIPEKEWTCKISCFQKNTNENDNNARIEHSTQSQEVFVKEVRKPFNYAEWKQKYSFDF